MSSQAIFRWVSGVKVEDLSNGIVAQADIVRAPSKGLITGFFSKPKDLKPEDINKVKIEIKQHGKLVSKGQ